MMAMGGLQKRIKAAKGEILADLVLKGGLIINVFTRDIQTADVAVVDGFIAGIGSYEGLVNLDVRGKYISPGFIDGHIHIESSLLTPVELSKGLIANGTTAVVADPHEIANVLGRAGIRYLLDRSEGLPVDFFFMLPSCVPATEMETSGAHLSAEYLPEFLNNPKVIGLAEMMNYPGVLSGLPEVIEKIAAVGDRIRDGHAPLLSGRDLNAYLACGIRSDHECSRLEEAFEKIRLGMHIMIREGTQAKNLRALAPIVTPATAMHCSLVTDDLHPHDLMKKGHLNHLLDLAVSEGIDPITAVLMASYSTARYFGLRDRGAVAPGYRADIAVLSSLHPVGIETVIQNGRVIYSEGKLNPEYFPHRDHAAPSAIRIKAYSSESFCIPRESSTIRVIGLIPDQLITLHEEIAAPVRQGLVVADPERDLVKLAVLERHRATGNIGLGMVKGLGLRKGALASSVAHDSHNVICAGCNDADMFAAVKCVEEMGGGLAAAADGKVLAKLELPIAGLISDRSLGEVASQWEVVRLTAQELGCRAAEPFMTLSFLALPVIPELKLTDRGLFDVRRFEHIPLFV